MGIRNIGFRLQSEGKAEIKNDFAEVRAAGVAAMDGVADAAEDAARRASAANDDFTKRQLDSWKKQADAAKLNAARADVRSSFDDTLGRSGNVNLDRSTGQARASAEVFEAHARAQDEAAAAALKLKAAIDPLWAAEDRLASELAQVALAEKAGILTADQLGDAQARARKRFDETTDAIKRQGTANTGLSKMQRQTLIYTASDIVASSASGASPAMIAMQQGPQVLQAFAAEEGGMAALKATLTGTAAAIGAVTIAAGIGAMAWNDYTSSAAKLSAAARGTGVMLGLSGDELMRSAEAAADAGKISMSSARDLEAGYLGVARSGDVLVKLTAITRDYAAATGQDMAGAQRELAAAFVDPIAGADDLASKYGVLTQAQVEQITKLAEQNDLAGAQRVLLEALGPAFVGAADNANALARGWENIKNAASDAWNWMGRALDRMATGGTIAQRIQQLQKDRERGPSVGQMLLGTSTAEYQAGIDRQIAGLNQQLRQEAARSAAARSNAAQAAAQGVVDRYAGDQRGSLRADAARLRAALKTDLPADQRAQITSTLSAYMNALDTWMPKQEKANRLAAIDAQIAAAKTPAAKAALASERARVEMAGQLATSADVESRATSAGTRARENATKSGDKHAESLRRQAEAMEASARGALDVADAYLKSSAAGITAEVRRKALTDATRRGIDVEAQVRRELNLQVADAVANGGKALAQVRDETAARQAILAQYRDGKLSIEGMSTALADEAALRPLLRLRTIAQGDALTALNKVIDAYREGLGKAHDAENQFGLEKALSQSVEKAEDLRAVIGDLGRTPLDQILNATSRAANIEADGLKLAPGSDDRQKLVRTRVAEAEAGYNERRARYAFDAARSQADALALTQREFELISANDNVRAAELDKLRTEQDIRRQFPDMAQADIDARLAGIDAQARANEQLKIAAAGLAEMRDFGSQLVDDALDPSKWEDWGAASKNVLEMIKGEFIALALLNPLKNMINGNSNLPTISSALSSFGKLFGGGSFDASAIRSGANAALDAIPRNATGTEHFSGGLTYVHENGGEIMDLPTGTRIYPAAETRRMMAANDTGPSRQRIDINLNTPLFTAAVADVADQRVGVHAPGIAAGGAELGRDQMRKAQRRKMGRR